jgi:hypothetical protein
MVGSIHNKMVLAAVPGTMFAFRKLCESSHCARFSNGLKHREVARKKEGALSIA